ncbi:hypothetical protein CSAL01_10570 [Colletotrichum salicis]|uniref:Uncharacterized protein n=1 Tax=Colletotrichum salicis TaxID=1209931 RepID=A0A135URL4_9PEZI|nr:hypothetical protein CSAL01_10570 [Colletotrichum salicis]
MSTSAPAEMSSQQSQAKPVTTPTTLTAPPLVVGPSPSTSFFATTGFQAISPLAPAGKGTPQPAVPFQSASVGQVTAKPSKSANTNDSRRATATSQQHPPAQVRIQKEATSSLKSAIMPGRPKPYKGEKFDGWKRWARRQKDSSYERYPASSKVVDAHISAVLWDSDKKKPNALSEQGAYGDFMKDWKATQYKQRPPSAPLIESIRLINNLSLPQDIVTMLEIAGWDATKCCNPTLPHSEKKKKKKLTRGSPSLKRSSEKLESESDNNAEVVLAEAKQQQGGSSFANAISLIDDPEDEDVQPSDQSTRQASSSAEAAIANPKKALPLLATLQPPKPPRPRVIASQNGESAAKSSVDLCLQGMPDTEPEQASKIDGIAKSAEQLTNETKSTKSINQDVKLLSNKPQSPSSSSSKSGKRVSTKDLRRGLHKVKKLAALSGNHTTQLQDQGGQLLAQTQKLDNLERAAGDQANNIYKLAMELEAHAAFLKKQNSTMAQLRNDNQALRTSLQDVLFPLARAVNAMQKSTKKDKRMLESNAKRANKELKEFEAAGRNAEAVKRGTRNLGQILGTPQGDRMEVDGQHL